MDTPPPWTGSPFTDPSGSTAYPWTTPEVLCGELVASGRVVTFAGGPLNGVRRALECAPRVLQVPCMGDGPTPSRVATAVYRLDPSGCVYTHDRTDR